MREYILAILAAVVSGCVSVNNEAYLASRNQHIDAYWRYYAQDAAAGCRGFPPNFLALQTCNTNITVESAEATLGDFASRYMPNAYAGYLKKRERAMLCLREFIENLSGEEKKNVVGSNVYQQAVLAVGIAGAESLRRRDELIHYCLLHKAGGLSAADLAALDQSPKTCRLLSCKKKYGWDDWWVEMDGFGSCRIVGKNGKLRFADSLSSAAEEFADKYMPEAIRSRKHIWQQRMLIARLYGELHKLELEMDYSRFDMSMIACMEAKALVTEELSRSVKIIEEAHVKHAASLINIEEIESINRQLTMRLKEFSKIIETYVQERARGPLFAPDNAMAKFYPQLYRRVTRWNLEVLGFSMNSRGDTFGREIGNMFDTEFTCEIYRIRDIFPTAIPKGGERTACEQHGDPYAYVVLNRYGTGHKLVVRKLGDAWTLDSPRSPTYPYSGNIEPRDLAANISGNGRGGDWQPSILSCLGMDVDGRCYDFVEREIETQTHKHYIDVSLKK